MGPISWVETSVQNQQVATQDVHSYTPNLPNTPKELQVVTYDHTVSQCVSLLQMKLNN
jgi:hypothetical protein